MLRAVCPGINTKEGGKWKDLGEGFGSPVAGHCPVAGTWPAARCGVAGAGPARQLHCVAAPPALGVGDPDGSKTAIPARPAPVEAPPAPPAASASRPQLESGGWRERRRMLGGGMKQFGPHQWREHPPAPPVSSPPPLPPARRVAPPPLAGLLGKLQTAPAAGKRGFGTWKGGGESGGWHP